MLRESCCKRLPTWLGDLYWFVVRWMNSLMSMLRFEHFLTPLSNSCLRFMAYVHRPASNLVNVPQCRRKLATLEECGFSLGFFTTKQCRIKSIYSQVAGPDSLVAALYVFSALHRPPGLPHILDLLIGM